MNVLNMDVNMDIIDKVKEVIMSVLKEMINGLLQVNQVMETD